MTRVFIDLDGPTVDFDGHMAATGMSSDQMKRAVGAYLAMPQTPGAVAAIDSVVGMGYQVHIATKPPTGVPHAYADKAAWVMEHLPTLQRRIILTHDKGLLGGPSDFLIDDRVHKANCTSFQGTVLHYRDGFKWPEIQKVLSERSPNAPRARREIHFDINHQHPASAVREASFHLKSVRALTAFRQQAEFGLMPGEGWASVRLHMRDGTSCRMVAEDPDEPAVGVTVDSSACEQFFQSNPDEARRAAQLVWAAVQEHVDHLRSSSR